MTLYLVPILFAFAAVAWLALYLPLALAPVPVLAALAPRGVGAGWLAGLAAGCLPAAYSASQRIDPALGALLGSHPSHPHPDLLQVLSGPLLAQVAYAVLVALGWWALQWVRPGPSVNVARRGPAPESCAGAGQP